MELKLLSDEVAGQVKEVFTQLTQPLDVLFFGRDSDCDYCEDTLQIVQEVTSLSDMLTLSIYDLERDAEVARQYNVDKAPGLVIAGRKDGQMVDYGIRYAGIPAGHEFSALIHDLLLVSGRDSGLEPMTRDYLKGLSKPVLLQVFTTPT
jgi:alkyl hydroperoxide reductase subunit AhpF